MILKYKYGFYFCGVLYGWKDKKLYRLPQIINKRYYPLREVKKIAVGLNEGYYISRKKKSIKQLESMTVFINFEINKIKDSDLPF